MLYISNNKNIIFSIKKICFFFFQLFFVIFFFSEIFEICTDSCKTLLLSRTLLPAKNRLLSKPFKKLLYITFSLFFIFRLFQRKKKMEKNKSNILQKNEMKIMKQHCIQFKTSFPLNNMISVFTKMFIF